MEGGNVLGSGSLFGREAQPMTPFEMVSIARDFLNSGHPLVVPICVVITVLFIIPILGGLAILAIEGRPKAKPKTPAAAAAADQGTDKSPTDAQSEVCI